jgi:hypothetical protein
LPILSGLVREVDFFGKFIRLRVLPDEPFRSSPTPVKQDIAVDIPPQAPGSGLTAGRAVRLRVIQSWELPGEGPI